jgi:hypothetical protein
MMRTFYKEPVLFFNEPKQAPPEFQFYQDDVDWIAVLPKGEEYLPDELQFAAINLHYDKLEDGRTVVTSCHA